MAARAAMASKMAYQKEKERKMKRLKNGEQVRAGAEAGAGARAGARARPLVYCTAAIRFTGWWPHRFVRPNEEGRSGRQILSAGAATS